MSESSPSRPIWYYPAYVFWNFAESRLRFLWRLVGVIIFTLIFTNILGLTVLPFNPEPPEYVLQLILYIAILVAAWLAVRFLDRRQFLETGIFFTKAWWLDLAFGSLLGAILMTAIFVIELAAGWISIRETFVAPDSTPFALAILAPLGLFISVSLAEELLFRGYLLLNLAEGLNSRFINARTALLLAWLLTSALFGFAHLGNENATWTSSFNIALAGIFIGSAYVLTGSLAIPLGIHLTWNFFQGNVFGFPVSGMKSFSTTVFAIEQGGPLAWTGGAFGPEAGIIGLLAMLVGTLSIIWWVRWHYGKVGLHTAIAEPPQRAG